MVVFFVRENIKRQAYLVLEENKVLQEQLDLQTNQLTNIQKTQIHEGKELILCLKKINACLVSNLTRRLMIVESEKTEADRTLETVRIRNEELRKKYEQLIIDNDHRMHVEDHVREITEMKRLTGS
jgi:predicted metal-dependent hydrolase